MEFDVSKRWCYYFNELCRIPHPSRHEEAVAAYVKKFAEDHNLEVHQARWGNTVVRKPGSKGCEDQPWLMLQAHMDMVPAKTPDSTHNFETDPLQLYVDDQGQLRAKGTTLGADDGVGVACMLAILEDDSLVHPPLECVFTVMEEIGLEGALHMKPEQILSRRVISLDGGGETSSMCCAAGGIKGYVQVPAERHARTINSGIQITIHGLLGGHSGIMIDHNHANAIVLAERLLNRIRKENIPFEIGSFTAGAADNSIADHASILLNTNDRDAVIRVMNSFASEIHTEYLDSDPAIQMESSLCEPAETVLDDAFVEPLLDLISLIPNGVVQYNIPLHIPSTSNNIGLLEEGEEDYRLWFRTRGLLDSAMDMVLDAIIALAELVNGSVTTIIRYPGWNYQKDSPLREAFNETIQELYGHPCTIEGSHGGNETGIWAGLHPDSDIISIGSIEEEFHTPNERLDLAAFDRLYKQLTVLIAKLAR